MSEKKTLMAISASSIRRLIAAANDEQILKEDIVSLTTEGGEFVLIYYSK